MMILPPTTCKCFLCASNKQDIVRMHPISSTTIEIFRKFVLKAECSHTSRIFLELILPWEKWEPGCFFFIVTACQSHCRRGLVRITGVRGKQSSKELSSCDGSIEMTSGRGEMKRVENAAEPQNSPFLVGILCNFRNYQFNRFCSQSIIQKPSA